MDWKDFGKGLQNKIMGVGSLMVVFHMVTDNFFSMVKTGEHTDGLISTSKGKFPKDWFLTICVEIGNVATQTISKLLLLMKMLKGVILTPLYSKEKRHIVQMDMNTKGGMSCCMGGGDIAEVVPIFVISFMGT